MQRALAAKRVAQHINRIFHLHAGQRVAVYSSLPEELDTAPLITLAQARGCRIYLPRIDRRTLTLRFVETGRHWSVNHLGISEPRGSRVVGARWLDLVLLPLVGFDARGMRLGMGGGYYDRSFAFRRLRKCWRGPKLIGIGFALQQLPSIAIAKHDVLLDAVVTENGIVH